MYCYNTIIALPYPFDDHSVNGKSGSNLFYSSDLGNLFFYAQAGGRECSPEPLFLSEGSGSIAFLAIKMDNRGKNQLETWEQPRGRKITYFWLWVMSVRIEVNMASLKQWYKVTRRRWDLRWLWARRLALWGKRTHTYTHIHTYRTITMRSYHWGS